MKYETITPQLSKNRSLGKRARNAVKRLTEYGYRYEAKILLECIEKLESTTAHFLGKQTEEKS